PLFFGEIQTVGTAGASRGGCRFLARIQRLADRDWRRFIVALTERTRWTVGTRHFWGRGICRARSVHSRSRRSISFRPRGAGSSRGGAAGAEARSGIADWLFADERAPS